jgi:hypothetical protein
MRKYGLLLAAALFFFIAPNTFAAGEIVLTMDDLPVQPLNGLVHPTGVQFGFTVSGVTSLDATYASGGPGSTTFVQDPSIEGTSDGVLSIIFPQPTPTIRFGVARSISTSLANGATVQLFNASNVLLGTTNLPMNPMPMFAEAQFTYSGAAAKRMTVGFPGGAASAARFAFDNLAFVPVPEPASCLLLVGGIVLALLSSRLTRRCR